MSEEKKILVVYSSRATGNSKKIAEALHSAFGEGICDIASAGDAPAPGKYDFIIMGFGVYRGWPDGDMRSYMRRCRNKNVGVFLTLAAYPDSEHAITCIGRAEGLLNNCFVRARFRCHGRLDPETVKRMKERPLGAVHSWDPERAKRLTEAETHPDEKDLAKAIEIFGEAWEKISAGEYVKKDPVEKKAILLATFGSSVTSAIAAYDNIERVISEKNPGITVRRAYISPTVRKKLNDAGGNFKSLAGSLNELFKEAFQSVKVVCVNMVPGEEYEKMLQEMSVFSFGSLGFREFEIAKPLLYSSKSLNRICDVFFSEIMPPERKPSEAVILMGHGNSHGQCDLNYIAAACEFNKRDKSVFLATVEGKPDFETLLKGLKRKKISKAYLMPFMIVAGDHAVNDLAGTEPDSWKSRLENCGVNCVPVLKGLGEYKGIAELFAENS